MLKLTFDESELTTLRGALELARDKYRENRDTLQKIEGQERLAKQFNRQAIDCESLMEMIDAAEGEAQTQAMEV